MYPHRHVCDPLFGKNGGDSLAHGSFVTVHAGIVAKTDLLVHGVFGDPSGTWTNPSGQSWAELMKGDDAFHGFTLATYRYDTPLRGRTSGIEEVATRLLRQLEDSNVFQKLQ